MPSPLASARVVRSRTFARLRALALSSLALPFALACGGDDPIGPVATLPVDAARLDAMADALAPILDQPVFDGFLLMRYGRGLPFDDGTFFPLRMTVQATSRADRTGIAGQRLPRLPAIPDSLRGRTFVRDSMTLGWRVETLPDGRPVTGAPAAGIRFVLSNAFVPGPASSARVGHMDMTQQGSGLATAFIIDVSDRAGAHVLHYASALSGLGSTGWTARGSTRVDQGMSPGSRGSTLARWMGSGVALEAERAESFSGTTISIAHTLTVDGRQLRLVATQTFAGISSTYTVLVDGAPFARRQDTPSSEGLWQHLAGRRPLSAGELAQVDAFLRVLGAIPDAQAAWEQAISELMSLQYPSPPM